ncbi:MAG: DeoR/GlpR family DNA-binding transcription regulator [Anaerostipes sp.]|jgi:DeoR/GlpR family transcriptional regulator of sugar metabolism|nr:DeoR/GlpR family DNA-binding transcription regulator [Anaerostipes sp.]MDD3745718.1 DeoR/GlpR family DNA-binding transcription regulator [Anaerostipes sp.]
MKDRQAAIVDYVSTVGKVEVSVLAEHFNISKVTIRKDLDFLSEKGILKRERGYALLNDPDDINYRMAFHYEVKERIARAAAKQVADGETILVEAGSTCAIFAEEAVRTHHNITIVTNSAHVAGFIKDELGANIILLGGNYQKRRQAMVGPMTKACLSEFKFDKVFLGIDGYSREVGFTGNDLLRADTLEKMIQVSNHVYVLGESEKYGHSGAISFLKFEDVHEVITDEGIHPEEVTFLKNKGINVTLV